MAALRWVFGTIALFALMLGAIMLLPSSPTPEIIPQTAIPEALIPKPAGSNKQQDKIEIEKPEARSVDVDISGQPRNVGRGVVPLPLDIQHEELERIAPLAAPPQPERQPEPIRLSGIIISSAGRISAQGKSITLEGIVPTSPEKICGNTANQWPCGIYARSAFRRFIRGRSVICELKPDEQSATTKCTLGRIDIARWLATYGWAEVEDGSPYAELVEAAKSNQIGIFAPQP